MMAFFQACISPLNLPFTILLLLVVLYWLAVIIGAADIDLFDADWMPDLDVDDTGGFLNPVFQLLGIGEIPIMAVISIMALSGWFFSLIGNHYLNASQSFLIGAGLLVPNLILTLFITGLFTRVFLKLVGPMSTKENQNIMFRVGVVITSEVNENFGQVQIETKGAPITINARTTAGTTLKKGEQVIVFDEDKEKGIYFVERISPDYKP